MPSYVIEFDSNHGPERRLFTLDDDRTLDVQLYQVLEELRQNGRSLQGAPGDELAVSWNGNELSQRVPLHALNVNATRPLILYMRPRTVASVPHVASKYNLRHIVLPPVEGALGALVAWSFVGLLTDLRAPVGSIATADLAAAVLLSGLIGLALNTGSVCRQLVRVPMAALCTVLAAVVGLLIYAAVATIGLVPTVPQFLLGRMGGWLLVIVPLALVMTTPLHDLGRQRYVEAALVALCAAVLSALIASLPGVSSLWQAIAFVTSGAFVGGAAISIPIWRTMRVVST